jgi:two-component system chemotaxis response regulator CheB
MMAVPKRRKPYEGDPEPTRDLHCPIRVLVVEDSAFMRRAISDILNAEPGIEVLGTARDGAEGVEMCARLRPDVVTLDIEMPRVDGLSALEQIMGIRPTPVIMLSALAAEGAEATLRALELGAVDFVLKPSGSISLDIASLAAQLVAKAKIASAVNPHRLLRLRAQTPPRRHMAHGNPSDALMSGVVAIAASTGGPTALQQMVPRLPGDLPAAVLIVQHLPPGFTASLASRLNDTSAIHVEEAKAGTALSPAAAYLAPGGLHTSLDPHGSIQLDDSPPVWGLRPAADPLMISAARYAGAKTVGVVMTGMGHDGTEGMSRIKASGGRTIAQDEKSCVVYGMPRSAAEAGIVDIVAPLDRIADEIVASVARLAA